MSTKKDLLVAAQTPAEIVDALDQLIPKTKIQRLEALHEHRYNQFIEQLQMIKSTIPVQVDAVCNYLVASKMRTRWAAKKIKQERLKRFRDNLLSIYHRHAAENRNGRESPEVRGQHTYNGTIDEANKTDSIGISGTDRAVELPFGTIEGEYHHMANGDDNVEVGWHPDWKHKLETGDIND